MVLSNKDFAFFGDLYVSFPFVVPEKIYVKGIGELTLNSKKRNINIIRLIFKQLCRKYSGDRKQILKHASFACSIRILNFYF